MRVAKLSVTVILTLCTLTLPALAKGKKAATGGKGKPADQRAISELMGKFKWGMSPEDVVKTIGENNNEKYAERLKQEVDVYKQDLIRKEQRDELDKIRESLVKFDGQKSGWDVSIIEKEFGHRNDESMLVQWEKDQRRFLFFHDGKLYKQFIAFNAEHPVFQGKTFDDFAAIIQKRYGQAQMKFAKLRTKDEHELSHLEWPVANDFLLYAIDQSGFYGNFCLVVAQHSVNERVKKSRADKAPKTGGGNALIDSVTAPEKSQADANEDVVDRITGKGKTK